MSNEVLFFTVFSVFIVGFLIFDLTVIGRKSHVVSFKESLIWTGVWVSIAVGFYVFIRIAGEKIHGIDTPEKLLEIKNSFATGLVFTGDFLKDLDIYRQNLSTEFITGYLVEYSLSIDNVFVIMMILSAFSVDEKYYKSVLFWGILGAIILRCIFIFLGAALVMKFSWILLLFGGFLVFSGVKMFLDRNKDEKVDPENHAVVKFLSKYFPVHKQFVEGKFFHKINGKKHITPLFVVLILVEFTDLIFAFDSIPAIFAVTRDPYIVFFSNIFAIIGLRSLFFLLSRIVHLFRFLKIGISFLLIFIGFKLLFHSYLDNIGFKTEYSLYIILSTLAISILSSVLIPDKKKAH